MIKTHDWTRMRFLAPIELKYLCELCEEFEDFILHLKIISPALTGYDVQRVHILSNRIMGEFLKCLRRNKTITEDDMKRITKEITTSLSNWFDKDGYPKDVTASFESAKKNRLLDFFLPIFLDNVIGFIHSKIYDSLIEAHDNSQKYFYNQFVDISIGRMGTVPERIEEKITVKKQEEE